MNARAMSLIELLEVEWYRCVNIFIKVMMEANNTPLEIDFAKPSFKVSNRGFRTMSYANTSHLRRFKVEANNTKYEVEVIDAGSVTIMEFMYDQEEEIKIDTIRHEIAHIIASYFRSCGHDKIWKNICTIIDANSTTKCADKLNYTNAPLHKVQPKHKVYCSCSEHDVTTYVYNKIVNNESVYGCKKCKGHIETCKSINAKFIKD